MKTKQFIRMMAVVLVALLAGSSPTWAAWGYQTTNEDEGGGYYQFRSENYSYGNDSYYASNVHAFRTEKTYNFDNDQFAWEYALRVLNPKIYVKNVALEGEILVVTNDDVSHLIATWSKTQSESSNVVGRTTDTSFGPISISKVDDGHWIKVRYLPGQNSFDRGVKRIIMKSRILYKDTWDSGWMQYERDIDLAAVFGDDKPLPKLSFEWTDNGDVVAKGINVPNKYQQSNFYDEAYQVFPNFPDGYEGQVNINPTIWPDEYIITDHWNGKMDITAYLRLSRWYSDFTPYTSVLYLKQRGAFSFYTSSDNSTFESFFQPYSWYLIKPFTHPTSLNVEFDTWNKRTFISWTRQNSVEGYNGSSVRPTVDCLLDGKWYVIRYEKDNPSDYTVVGTKAGDATSLQLTDNSFEYEKDYIYRVLFLPNILENKYKDHLTDPMPGDESSYNKDGRLWKEYQISTALDMPIKLAQDRTYLTAVHLVWEYCVQPSGQNWTIEYTPTGQNAWRTLDNSLTVDPKKSQASFDAEGTVCDLMDYRVKTTYADKEFYSNVVTGSLPAGSYISEVKATTGTEEKTVIVKWKVMRADTNNDIYYRVLRRQIGTEEWTLVTDDIHGTASEYTYTDDRVMAGSYYEYTVEAYAAKCEDQLVKTDEVITPGFSQARGTITGHIAFGTGTAVRDVRVNLVKSSADESTDQPQFLSRYIEGEGKGLLWKADSTEYANVLNSTKNLTLQLWARPDGNGATKMGLLNMPGTLELGVKRIDDTSGYELQLPVEGDDRYFSTDGWFMIGSAKDWELFASLVNGGRNKLNAIMTSDVNLYESLTMVGTSSSPYAGTFDGNGHTLTFNSTSHNEEYAAPFRYVGNATIRNLHVAGSIRNSKKFAASLIARLNDNVITVIENCTSSVNVGSNVDGDATNGGLVANAENSQKLTLRNCLFNGSLTGENSHSFGGLVGWSRGRVVIENSIFSPSSVNVKSESCCTFARMYNSNYLMLSNAYYTQTIGTEQGTSMQGQDNQTLLSILGSAWTLEGNDLQPALSTANVQAATRTNYTVSNVEHGNGTPRDSTALYQLYAVDLTTGTPKVKEFPMLTFSRSEFTHVAAVYDGASKWTFYVGNDTLRTDEMTVAGSQWNTLQKVANASTSSNILPTMGIGGSSRVSGEAFSGYVDDIRLWNRALSERDLTSNYTRILGGTENGLFLYWPLDEGISVKAYAFDVARQDGIYKLNHPEVGVNARPSATVPNAKYLALYGLTDSEGDYIIKGIPFQQGGTNYKLIPELGIHEFNPNTRSMFISPTSLTANNIDFEDVSSFPMEGYIYYAGTNIPAEGIRFYVDGDLVTADGKAQATNADGYYKISVPIGPHYVEANLDGHKMVDNGRFPTSGKFNFERAVQYDFADSTLVNFVGRIGGGERNDTLAVGFGASKNNIGMAIIQLKLNNESFSFNCKDDHITDAATDRTWDSDTTSIKSRAWTGTDYDAKYIYIRTDSLTGEFSALLPPLKYITKSIRLEKKEKNPNIEFTTLPEIDLTSVRKEMTDSLKQVTASGDSVFNYYKYNTKMVQTYFAKPEVSLWQIRGNGAFGEQEMKDYAVSSTEKMDITNIWTRESDGSINYTYQYPVFGRNKEYKFGVYGYEVYTNYDTNTAVVDTIPLNGQVLTIANEMSDEQDVVAKVIDASLTDLKDGEIYNLKKNQLRLDEEGKNEITFTTGVPNVAPPYTRQFSTSFVRGKRTYIGPLVNGIVLGELTNGNNFVTNGPTHVDMVLRDPPGSKGKTTWKTGTSYTQIENSTKGAYWDETISWDLIWGVKLKTAVGMGVAIISGNGATTTAVVGEKGSFQWLWKDDKTYVYTTADNISTSTGSKYVGASGDVFIGKSHNYIIGTCRKLGFHREADGIVLGLKEAVSINDSIKTDFMYSAYDIVNTMIPKIEDTRNSLLEYADSISAVSYQNTTDHDVYLTWLERTDPNFGKEKTYVWKPNPKGQTQNMVLHYNQSIKLWKDRLADNEQDKIEAARDQAYYKENRSFDGGTSYTYTERRDTTISSTYAVNKKVGFIGEYKSEFSINATATFGSNINFKTELGYIQNTVEGDSLENTKSYAEFDYELNDGNPGTDFTVDIYHSPRGWSDVFLLRGGQSYNPYEGEEKSKYYQEGEHIISYGTEQMEQPSMLISTDGHTGAKSATLTDVPAGQTGQFTLHLRNDTQTNQDVPFIYILKVQELSNNNGLEVLMDGFPANERSIFIPAGETITKTITVRQTDQSVLDYQGVELLFCSQYQPAKINDKVTFNVHFKPSSSPIDLAINEPVLNIETLDRNKGNLEMKLTNFDRQFKGMKKVGVEYRYEGATTWAQPSALTFLVNPADTLEEYLPVLPKEGDLHLTLNMKDDNLYPQGTYTFRAYTMTMYGPEPITVYSDELTVVKDNVRPRNLTTPEPTNGILRYGDDISIDFNEDIVPGYVSDKNIIVTAKLNNQPINHDVALQLLPYGTACQTVNPVFLNGDFSIEFWMKWTQGGFIIRQGKSITMMAMSLDNDGHINVSIGGNTYRSTEILPKDIWTYFVISYKASDMTFSALGHYGTESVQLFVNQPVTFSAVESVYYADDNYLYLGSGITGAIHDLALYNIYRDVHEAAAYRYVSKDQYIYGLTNYWPMNEGHGKVAADMRHTHDFEVNDRWELSNVNYSIETPSSESLTADISQIKTSSGDSYAIELWDLTFGGACTLFETGSVASNKLCLRYDTDMNLVLDYGENSQVVASHDDFPEHNSWHHLALNVVRGQAASFYYNGRRTAVIAEVDMPMLEGSKMKLGTGHNGKIDELRIWHATLTEERLLANMYNCIDTTDVYSRGLVAYYPFEKRETVNGVLTYVGTLEDMAPANYIPGHAITATPSVLSPYGPPVKKALEESRIIAKPVSSERKIVIRLEEGGGITARDVEGTTLNITVDKIHDMHGNQSNPIRWTSYVQLNTLKWTKDSVNVIKKYGDDYTFDVNIENRGGNTEYYTLYNMPQWLSLVDSERTDDINPLSTKTLRFKVSPLVAVGNYDVTIGLQGNNEILEPLRIVMKVSGEMPAWSVNPNAYENTMSIVGQIYINGILMGNSESRLVAFIGDECRAIAAPKQIRGAAFIPMSVYGTAQQTVNGEIVDLDNGMPITFRIWDATTGMTYTKVNITLPDGTVTDHLDFDPTKNYGTFDSPLIFTKSNLVEQPLNLRTGWNWLSMGVEPAQPKVVFVFKDLVTWNAQLKDKTSGVAYCRGNYWAGSLKEVHANTMYKLQLTRMEGSSDLPQPLIIDGEQVKLAETPVTIGKDWNWIAFTPMTTIPIGEALAGANPKNGDQVKSQTGFAYYGPYGWEGNLEALESGKGYLYFSTDNVTKQFVYPTVAHSRIVKAPKLQSPASAFSPVEPTDYPDNMAMVIMLTENGQAITTAEVAAFIDGECRGATFVTDNLYYLLIAGEGSGQPMEIKVCIDGTIHTVCNDLTYSSDGNIGTPWEPYVIDINDFTTITDVRTDYVPDVWYTLQGIRYGTDKPTTPGVYLYNGRKVIIRPTRQRETYQIETAH